MLLTRKSNWVANRYGLFTADYSGGELVVETDELEDARWFHRDELPLLPSRRSIARFLLDNYLLGGAE
ncbi:MAG: hypothetical protein B6I36_03475 [Desulfobacteraceae bacterium 4572_35.1]|nr:MAG: hypothetical protein B6I36_03475 [Desulfobacteraceae bacterium 4572_35.1]